MDTLRIRNLRSLADTKTITFKKINIFVGQNSSGKSSFIRALPLLKQSAQVKTVSDILWYGPFVDFGSFEEALSRNAQEEQIDFVFSMRARFRRSRYRPMSGVRATGGSTILPIKLRLRLKSDRNPKKTSLETQYDLKLFDQHIQLTLDEKLNVVEFVCGETDLTKEAADEFTFFRHFGLLPGVVIASEFDDEAGTFIRRIAELLENFVHGNKSKDELTKIASEIQLGPAENILEQLRSCELGIYWKNRMSELDSQSDALKKITTYIFARDFHHIFEATGDYISEMSNHIQYITPLRATAERYYRSQGLSVDEIDPQGRNLAMFLKNLSDEDANSFADWTATNMGFEVRAETLQGHVSVVLSDPGKLQRVNLADTGFGYSQVLPILAQLWQAGHTRRFSAVPRYFAIEQPELHLHPRMQARLADLFVRITGASDREKSKVSARRGPQFRLVIETHSEIIINQLGKAIERGDLSPNDVGIYIFEKDGFEGSTIVRESRFDEEGFLTDWPYGFFDATE